jgi:hypothetical protein
MDRNKKIILICIILILALISISATKVGVGVFLPLVRSGENLPTPTFDPCKIESGSK